MSASPWERARDGNEDLAAPLLAGWCPDASVCGLVRRPGDSLRPTDWRRLWAEHGNGRNPEGNR